MFSNNRICEAMIPIGSIIRKLILIMLLLHASACCLFLRAQDEIIDKMNRLSMLADFQGVIDYSNEVLRTSSVQKNPALHLFCQAHAAQSYIKTDWPEKAKEYLDSATVIVHSDLAPDERESMLYIEGFYTYSNAMVLYYVYDQIDYHKALTHAAEALDLAERRRDTRQSVIFGLNNIILNTMLQESFAYDGAEELYAKALELKDGKMIFNAAQICARRFDYLGDHARAKSYMETAIANMPEGYLDASTVYADYAKTFHEIGMDERAAYYYEKALKQSSRYVSSSTLLVYLSYAQFLSDIHHAKDAERFYLEGLSLADSVQTDWNRKGFYSGLYELYRKQRRYAEAVYYMDKYISETDSVTRQRQKKDITELRIKYETAVKEKIIAQNEILIARQNRRFSIIFWATLLLVVLSVFLTVLYFQKRASYITLFKLYSDTLSEQKQTKKVQSLSAGQAVVTPRKADGANMLFQEIDRKMKEEHIYREAGLTLEKAAELIHTNRTYLSAAIKQQTGLSFIYYINSYRIQEAIELLSDSENDTPLKAILVNVGFKSPTTFYKLFQATTGKTPQTWREEARQKCAED